MSKKIKLFSVALVVFVVVLVAFAGTALAATYTPGLHSNVVDSVHNLGTVDDVCTECHLPHGANASAEYLWALTPQTVSLPSGDTSDIISLCYSCHDGTGGNTIGDNTVFATGANYHPLVSYENNSNKGGKDCDRCHDPHENSTQRPNFIRYKRISTSATATYLILGPDICASCHTGNVSGGTPHGGTGPANDHPIDAAGSVSVAYAKGSVINPSMVVYDPSTSTPGTRMFAPLFTPTPTAPTAAQGSPDLGAAEQIRPDHSPGIRQSGRHSAAGHHHSDRQSNRRTGQV